MAVYSVGDLPLTVDIMMKGQTVVVMKETRISQFHNKSTLWLVGTNQHIATADVAVHFSTS